MSLFDFIKLLIGAAILSVASFFLINIFVDLSGYFDFLLMSIGFFALLTIGAYIFGELSINRSGGAGYIGLVIANVFLKLIGSFLFVALYAKYNPPPNRNFLIPFLVTYLVFTGVETYFMSLQARGRK